jgi:hypothetical protein
MLSPFAPARRQNAFRSIDLGLVERSEPHRVAVLYAMMGFATLIACRVPGQFERREDYKMAIGGIERASRQFIRLNSGRISPPQVPYSKLLCTYAAF